MSQGNCNESIELPTDQIFSNLTNAKRFAIDIGGSLVKLAYYSTVPKKRALVVESDQDNCDEIYQISEQDELCDRLHFVKFETKYIETCVDFIQRNLVGSSEFMKDNAIKVTGSGAHKYKDMLSKKLGAQIDREDEMQCLINGCNFLLKNIPDESFVYQRPDYKFQITDHDTVFPYLLVNIGSGVSFVKVESENSFERVGGTSIGGGTFWGLGSIITKAKDFDELLNIAEQGDHRNVDMLVGDIYGGMFNALNLPADLIASSFGKAARSSLDRDSEALPKYNNADIAKSLLISISNDIGQIACLTAKLYQLKKIYFGGYFIRGRPITMNTITFAINYWSKGEIQAMFLRHEGYLGAIGAFLKVVEEEDANKYSWGDGSWSENYAGSSGLASPNQSQSGWSMRTSFAMLELDRFAKPLVNCPLLLDSAGYFPDTVDLSQDEEARDYWLQCFEEATEKFTERAIRSQPSKSDAEQRARRFKDKYLRRLQELKVNPCAYGSLNVRSLLDTREHCLEEFHFVDPLFQQKQLENELALKLLSSRLEEIDSLPSECQWLAVVEGVLGGNVFDWGAKEVASLMELTDFGFRQALSKLQARPWLVDDFDSWLQRMEGPPHKCAIIFVDNSGIDIILGIFPFARALLKRGTNVVLCANSRPVLNDVTYNELSILTKRVASISQDISIALSNGRLLVMESGQGSPCLDLRYIDYDLSEVIKDSGADLVVLEGMGRAIHTNFDALFACESLKIAVIKNQWLAERLGGHMYSVVCKHEPARRVVIKKRT